MFFLRAVRVLSFAISALCCSFAHASDWYTGAPSSPDPGFGASVDTSLTTTGRGGSTVSAVGSIAPFSKIDQSGFRVGLEGVAGTYSTQSSAAAGEATLGREEAGAVVAGWAWSGEAFTAKALAGLEVREDSLNGSDAAAAPGTRAGARVEGEIYANPTRSTMVFVQGSYSTVRRAYYTHVKWGFEVAQNVFVGPEALYLGDEFYRQWRVGAHVSGVQLGALQAGISAGLVEDQSRGAGAYGALDLRVVF